MNNLEERKELSEENLDMVSGGTDKDKWDPHPHVVGGQAPDPELHPLPEGTVIT